MIKFCRWLTKDLLHVFPQYTHTQRRKHNVDSSPQAPLIMMRKETVGIHRLWVEVMQIYRSDVTPKVAGYVELHLSMSLSPRVRKPRAGPVVPLSVVMNNNTAACTTYTLYSGPQYIKSPQASPNTARDEASCTNTV